MEAREMEHGQNLSGMPYHPAQEKFTFAKVWLMKAQFEVRQMQLQAARKTLGQAIGMCLKDKLFRGYIEIRTTAA